MPLSRTVQCSLLACTLLVAPAHAYVLATDGGGRPLRWHAPRMQLSVVPPPGELGAALLQATERAGPGDDNKGYEAVCAALDMLRLIRNASS